MTLKELFPIQKRILIACSGNVHRVQELANDKVINMTLEGGKQSIHIAAESGEFYTISQFES